MTAADGAVLVVGGTGPTGVPLVEAFRADERSVTIFHSGAHEWSFDRGVEHLHGDARSPAGITAALGDRCWDVVVCTSGRLRALADALAGRCRRLVGITGQPVYAGTMRPTPHGVVPLPVPEWATRQHDAAGYTGRVAAGEDQLLDQHRRGDFEAVVVRYPGVFGPRAPMAHEWAVVKRVLDGRRVILLPHDGTAYFQRGYVDNVAHLVHRAATRPEAAGLVFNAGDERVLSARRVAEVICEELGAEPELLGVPAPLCPGAFPLAEKSSLVLDMGRARMLLGYRDRVGVEDATRRTARWLAEHPPAPGDVREAATGPFDYAADDRVAAAWRAAMAGLRAELGPASVPEAT